MIICLWSRSTIEGVDFRTSTCWVGRKYTPINHTQEQYSFQTTITLLCKIISRRECETAVAEIQDQIYTLSLVVLSSPMKSSFILLTIHWWRGLELKDTYSKLQTLSSWETWKPTHNFGVLPFWKQHKFLLIQNKKSLKVQNIAPGKQPKKPLCSHLPSERTYSIRVHSFGAHNRDVRVANWLHVS